ncbi:hypothetical protein K8R47_03290 [archaeon]|nr:hypothetical protein [archaeon]
MKKGVIMQPIAYVFMIIVIAMILLFGTKIITDLENTKQQGIYVQFKTDFQSAISNVYTKNLDTTMIYSQTSSHKPLQVPKSVQNVCFRDGNRLDFDPPGKFNGFPTEHLSYTNEHSNCIIVRNNKFSFKLVNEIENGETVVKLYPST